MFFVFLYFIIQKYVVTLHPIFENVDRFGLLATTEKNAKIQTRTIWLVRISTKFSPH